MIEEENKKFDEILRDPEVWDMSNMHDFFKLLLVVDKRINPKLYKPENND